jgi:hypothetical protein
MQRPALGAGQFLGTADEPTVALLAAPGDRRPMLYSH